MAARPDTLPPDGQEAFERALILGCLAALSVDQSIGQQQLMDAYTVRKMTGVGAFIEYTVPDTAPLMPLPIRAALISTVVELTGEKFENGIAEGLIRIGRSGKLLGMELHAMGGLWPSTSIDLPKVNDKVSVHGDNHLENF